MNTPSAVLHLNGLSALALAMTLAGCATPPSPITLALTELGTSSSKDYGRDKIQYMRAVSVSGLDAQETIGVMSLDADKNNYLKMAANWFDWSQPDLPDSMNLRVISGCSKLLVTEFVDAPGPDNNAVTTITKLRPKLDELQQMTPELTAYRVLLPALLAAQDDLAHASTPEAQSQVLQAVGTAFPFLGMPASTEGRERDVLAQMIEAAKSKLEALAATHAQLSKDAQALMSVPGVMVTNWSQKNANRAELGAGQAGSFQRQSEHEVGGYMLLANPRVSTLLVGSDMVCRLRQLSQERADRPANDACEAQADDGSYAFLSNKRPYLTTHQLRAKAVMFSEDRSDFQRTALMLDLGKVAKVASGLAPGAKLRSALETLEVKAKVEFNMAQRMLQSGFIASQHSEARKTSWVYEFRLAGLDYQKSIIDEIQRSAHTVPVYSARIAFNRLNWRDVALGKCSGDYQSAAIETPGIRYGQAEPAASRSTVVAGAPD